ncbi:hypothetical protein HPB47_019316, partial [Ixodes persulcatus]
YGIMNEPLAAKRDEEVLRSMGHDVTITSLWIASQPGISLARGVDRQNCLRPRRGV